MSRTTPELWLSRAVQLAYDNVARGERPFGAVVVEGDAVLAEGVNTTLSAGDPTCHAEVQAIRAACRRRESLVLEGCIVYTSCEPCAMCVAVAANSGISRLVFACTSRDAAELGFPATAATQHLQDTWRAASPGFTVHAATPGADRPFLRWNETRRSQP